MALTQLKQVLDLRGSQAVHHQVPPVCLLLYLFDDKEFALLYRIIWGGALKRHVGTHDLWEGRVSHDVTNLRISIAIQCLWKVSLWAIQHSKLD